MAAGFLFLLVLSLTTTTFFSFLVSAQGDPVNGWGDLPRTSGTLVQSWELTNGSIPVYQSSHRMSKGITRAVIVLSGVNRDCWSHFDVFNDALVKADRASHDIDQDKIALMSVCFLDKVDLDAGAARGDNLVWEDASWISGVDQLNPKVHAKVSSFDVLDQLVAYYLDRQVYPNLQTVVISGHSAGGQMSQRYSMLRLSSADNDRIQFWLGNPASFVWLTTERPDPIKNCEGWDEFKFGLNGSFPRYFSEASELDRAGLVERYRSRYIHYSWGTEDNELGDTSCQAMMQGGNHYQRGKNFVKMLNDLPGNATVHSTIDWIKGVGHDVDAMIHREAAWSRVFRYLPSGISRRNGRHRQKIY